MRIEVTMKLDFDEATVDDVSGLLETLGEAAQAVIGDVVGEACETLDVVLDDSEVEVRRV